MEYTNGWTKETVTEHLKKHFKGKSEERTAGFGTSCRYRSYDGKKCVVGCFIPDDMYREQMDPCGASALLTDFPQLEEFMPFKKWHMESWQLAHDGLRADRQTVEEQLNQLLKFLE